MAATQLLYQLATGCLRLSLTCYALTLHREPALHQLDSLILIKL
jgi:hypothetical protein